MSFASAGGNFTATRCQQCGESLRDGDKFCGACGAVVLIDPIIGPAPVQGVAQPAVEPTPLVPTPDLARAPRAEGTQQMVEGFKQLAAGAKEVWATTAAPAVAKAASSARTTMTSKAGPSAVPANNRVGLSSKILPLTAIAASCFLLIPVDLGPYSVRWFDDAFDGEGWWLLTSFLVVLASAVAALVVQIKWIRVTAAVIGVVAGIFAVFDGFSNGAIFLGLAGLAMLLAAIVTLVPQGLLSRNSGA